jgi:hypothetical protein
VLARFGEWGVVNPNADNVKAHLKRHIEFVAEQTVEEQKQEVERIYNELRTGEMEFVDPTEVARFALTVYYDGLVRKHAKGEDLGLTHDHATKFISELTKRKQNDAQVQLLEALGGGIERVFTKALGGDDHPALPAADVDGEVIEEAEVVPGA